MTHDHLFVSICVYLPAHQGIIAAFNAGTSRHGCYPTTVALGRAGRHYSCTARLGLPASAATAAQAFVLPAPRCASGSGASSRRESPPPA